MGLMAIAEPTNLLEIDKFNTGMLAFSKRIEYRRIVAQEDFEEIGRLRAISYNRNNFLNGRTPAIILDEEDFKPYTHCFGVYLDGKLALTFSVQHISKGHLSGPALDYFPDTVHSFLDQNMRFVVPIRFAMDPDFENRGIALPLMAIRLGGMAMRYFQTNGVLSLIRKGHAAYHRRFFMATQIAPLTRFEDFSEPIMLFKTDIASEEKIFRRYPFFRSLALEQRMLFGPLVVGKPNPLTVLPTACEALGIFGHKFDPELADIAS